ncbi:MAG: response regulator [Chloroflexota bacterium]
MTPTVLVVDDESVTRRLVIFSLKTLNVEVLPAEDATEALEMAHTHCIDLMLVDINLPDIDGLTLIKHLREIPKMENVPIISFTARNDSDDETRARELGAKGFLYKPFSTQELRELVTYHLGM